MPFAFVRGTTAPLSFLLVFIVCLSVRVSNMNVKIFPDTLEGFGYGFNSEGKLRKLIPGTNEPGEEGFEFTISDNQEENQNHYEALGQVITKYVYTLLETEGQLQKLDVPNGTSLTTKTIGNIPLKSFIFASNDALTNPNCLLLLIHGSGVVRAGQWARSLIINDNLKTGTQIPYIHRARKLGYGILVLNTNDNFREVNEQSYRIQYSATPSDHANYVWEEYVRKARAQHIAIVAHSYGGVVTMDLAQGFYKEFQKRVVAVAFTDSVHNIRLVPSKVVAAVQKVGRNWVASSQPLDAPVGAPAKDVVRVSAGTGAHERTSATCLESAFAFIEEQVAASAQALPVHGLAVQDPAAQQPAAKGFGGNLSHFLQSLLRR